MEDLWGREMRDRSVEMREVGGGMNFVCWKVGVRVGEENGVDSLGVGCNGVVNGEGEG